MGNRVQGMFGIGEVTAIAVARLCISPASTTTYYGGRAGARRGAAGGTVDRPAQGARPACWLIQHGRFRQAKQVSLQMFDDPLDMLPDEDFV